MPDIQERIITANGLRQFVIETGKGPAMILLHGWPQTNFAWRKIVPELSQSYHIIAPDLRGLGQTEKTESGYDIRNIATDIKELLRVLNLDQPIIVGHDWGGLVARRFSLDWPGEARALAILDVAPHEQVLSSINANSAQALWHFFFNAVHDLPEKLVAGRADIFLRYLFRDKCYDPDTFLHECLEHYTQAYNSEHAFRAGAQYYKAMFSENREIDQQHNSEKITCPLLCLWGTKGGVGGVVDLLAMWQREAVNVSGCAFEKSGHYIPEEEPEKLIRELNNFIAAL